MLEQLFINAPTAMILINPVTNRILIANKQAEKLFTLNRRTLTQYTVTQFFPDCVDKLHSFTQQVLSEGAAWSSELTIRTANKHISIGINASQFANNILLSCEDGSVTFERHFKSRIESNYRSGLSQWDIDETVFEQIERQNQLLLTAVGDGIYGVDCEGKTTFVNAAAESIIGWTKEQLMGKKIHDIIHHTHLNGSHYDVHNCPIYAAFNDGAIHSVDNEVFWSQQGKAIPVEYTSTPLTENGTLIGAVVIFRDITERKRTQDKLLTALKEVDALKHRLEMENAYLQEEINADFNHQYLIGNSHKIKHMMNQIELVAPTDANVLIIGESGTGKELIARAIHEASQRKVRPLIRVNCAAIPAELFESEFFGHIKGAFSGALSDRVGRFELADGATIFLDEVGEIPLQLQSKLLRVLQEQQFERVGESITRNVNVRVIAATNQNLTKLVANNKFREDLYFRLNVFPINSPPLRERIDDLPLLVKHFIDKVCTRLNQPPPQVSIAQMQHLTGYNWPGNIRELENIIERQVILSKSNKLNFEFLNKDKLNITSSQLLTKHNKILSVQQQKQLERDNLIQALKACQGKIYGTGGAAELLGLKPTTLSSKLKKHAIQRRHYIV